MAKTAKSRAKEKNTLSVLLSDDLQSAGVQMAVDGKDVGYVIFDAIGLENVIGDMARCRSRMAEQVTPTLDPNSRIQHTTNPAWLVPETHSGQADQVVLALRDPGLGWRAFVLSKKEALHLSAVLQVRCNR